MIVPPAPVYFPRSGDEGACGAAAFIAKIEATTGIRLFPPKGRPSPKKRENRVLIRIRERYRSNRPPTVEASSEIEKCIYQIRGKRVLLDEDLARLYQVSTKAFNQAIKRNIERFPSDFMFFLSDEEYSLLRSQIVTVSGKAGRRARPPLSRYGAAWPESMLLRISHAVSDQLL